MFERFTDRARRAVVLAQEEAVALGHDNIGTEHLLLGLVSEGDGVAAQALEELGVTLAGVREQVEALMGRGQPSRDAGIPFTSRARKVLEFSLREALQLDESVIGTEHLLLGLTRDREAVAARVLDELGIDLARVRSQVLQRRRGPATPEEPAVAPGPGSGDDQAGWTLLSRGAESTWRALLLARQKAAQGEHGAVEVSDLVLGVLHTGDAQVTDALVAAGADAAALGGPDTALADAGPGVAGQADPPALALAPAARAACSHAVALAGPGAGSILPAHVLLGLLAALDARESAALSTRLRVEIPELVSRLARSVESGGS